MPKLSLVSAAVLGALCFSHAAYAGSPSTDSRASLLSGANATANALLRQNAAVAAALQSATDDTFDTTDVIQDANGDRHVRMQRYFHGLEVIGGDVVMHLDGKSQFRQASANLRSRLRPDLNPRISAVKAEQIAQADFGGSIDSVQSKGLVIYAFDPSKAPVLAYEVRVEGFGKDGGRGNMRYFVNALDGQVLNSWNLFQTDAAVGTGKSLLLGNVELTTNSVSGGSYQLLDPSRGSGAVYDAKGGKDTSLSSATLFTGTSNVWGDNTESNRATVAADIAYGLAKTWDYYKTVQGRNGIANDGKGVKSYAHVQVCSSMFSCTTVNAAWNGSAMEYGDGNSDYYPLVAIDVAGHEMSHGVTGATAKLAYTGDAGGLNEANSDIMGTMVEYYANTVGEPPNYLIGERLYRSNADGTSALRYMFKPSLDKKSADCWSSSVAKLDPHYSSGVGNHFYYLLAEGSVVPQGFGAGTKYNLTPASLVCSGNSSLTGIGRDAAQKIWYRALTTYMTSNTNYPGARTATLNAAKDLYGASSTQYNAVAQAWSAVSVN